MSEILSPAVDVRAFASQVLGFTLFDHQSEFLRSPSTYRAIVAGRQCGKTRAIATECLFRAATHANYRVLIVSQGEAAALEVLAECSALASASSTLRGSVLDESGSELTLSNGSQIKAVPASQRQIRGRSIDLLCVDESGFIDPLIWQAAEPTIAARPGARVILASTPWGTPEHWFRQLYRRGLDAPDKWVESFHWSSDASPLVNAELLEFWRRTWSDLKYKTEVLAEWADSAGSYFSEAEIEAAAADYELVSLESITYARRLPAVAGIDWGMARDANALVLVSPMDDFDLNVERLGPGGRPLFVPFVEARVGWAWTEFIDRAVEVAGTFDVQVIASETNGVGAYPTDDLAARIAARVRGGCFGTTHVAKVWTDVRRKQSGFSKIKGLMETGRLVLPRRHPELLKQLRALEFEQLPGGSLRIAVPETSGHDDVALALMQAVSSVVPAGLRSPAPPAEWSYRRQMERRQPPPGEQITTSGSGLRIPVNPRPDQTVRTFATFPEGQEKGSSW